MAGEFKPRSLQDLIASAYEGMNCGVAPLLLQKSQIAFGWNTSIRGGYLTHRPPVIKHNFIWPSPAVQAQVEDGLFQGGGYYRPDYGVEQLVAQISGRLFTFTEQGGSFVVADISIAGDLNDAGQHQVWMWQAEKWMIISDGSGRLPIFYDGTGSRRSYGDSVVLGTTNASFTPPATGSTVAVSLTANYAGPYNVPVLLNGAYYQPILTLPGGYNAVLTNITDIPATTEPAGSQLIVKPSVAAVVTGVANAIYTTLPMPLNTASLEVDDYSDITIGDKLTADGIVMTVTNLQIVAGIHTITATVVSPVPPPDYGHTFPVGTEIKFYGNSSPNVILSTTTAAFIVPAVGATVDVILDNSYTGVPNQTVWIGSYQYTINPIPTPGLSSTLTLINLTDNTSGTPTAAALNLLSVPELPAGRMGAYGLQQNWMSLVDGLSFVFSDISGGASGTQANNWRDAVLKTTQLTFGAGSFSIPSAGETINSITFTANLDAALGQGSVQIGTDSTMFSCIAPVDADSLATITSPILTESLIGNGPLGQNSTIVFNSDIYFRSVVGNGSLVLARRDFNNTIGGGNKTISNEMRKILDADNQALLSYGSASDFDNRFNSTCSPNNSNQGVYHKGLVSLNFDLLSSLRGNLPAAWEGLWTGLNILQTITGKVNGTIRTFAFTLNLTTNKIELYELLPESTDSYLDNDITPIQWGFETAVLFNKDVKDQTEICQLDDGEMYLSDIKGAVNIKVQFRPDFYPCWTDWREFDVCSTGDRAGYRMRVGLGNPRVEPCEVGNNRPLRIGNFFQFRVIVTGSCKINGMKVVAHTVAQPDCAKVECTAKPCAEIDCPDIDYFSLYKLQG